MADIHANGRMSAKITVGTINSGIDKDLVYTKEEMNELLDNKADTVHAHEEYLTEVPSNYATTRISKLVDFNEETETLIYEHYDMTQEDFAIRFGSTEECALAASELAVQNANNIELIDTSLENKADINHTHDEYLTEHQDISHLATTSYVDDAIDNIDIPEVDLSNCATKEELNEVKQSVSNGKELLASAITDKGVNTSKDDTFQTMANNVSQITTGDGPVYENPDFYELRTNGGTDYSYLFYKASFSNKTLDLTNWDTSNVTNMSNMFSDCTVDELVVSGWDTSNVTNMSNMFDSFFGTLIGISNWDTSNATSMSNMFNSICTIEILDLSNWDTSNVINMSDMFRGLISIINTHFKHLNLSNWDTSNVTDMSNMFRDCMLLTELIGIENFNTSNVTNMQSMFYNCDLLTSLDLSNWDTSKVTDMYEYLGGFIADCSNLEEVIGILDLSKVNGLSYSSNDKNGVFRGCPKLKKLQLKNIYKDVSMTNTNKWTINLSGTIIEDQYLISIINELPDLINDKGLTAPSKIKLMLPPTNTLTQEQVQPAIDKGWQVTNTTY